MLSITPFLSFFYIIIVTKKVIIFIGIFLLFGFLPIYAIEVREDFVIFVNPIKNTIVGSHEITVKFTEDIMKESTIDHVSGKLIYLIKNQDTGVHQDYVKNFNFTSSELPKEIKFDITFENSGNYLESKQILFSGMDKQPIHYYNSINVVEKLSKAVNDNGFCKNSQLNEVIRPDYSSIVCVKDTTVNILKERGWY